MRRLSTAAAVWHRPMDDRAAERLAERIGGARRLVVLSGAGLSTAAGIPDFRGPQGLYVTRRYDPDTVFEISAFRRRPEPFFEFTRDFLSVVDRLGPTFTHRFLARLELDPLFRQVARVLAG